MNYKAAPQTQQLVQVCHASASVVKEPFWGFRDPEKEKLPYYKPERRDFGMGFYMCETKDQDYPIGLCSKLPRAFLNEYALDLDGLNPLYLHVNLVWFFVVAAHRRPEGKVRAENKKQWRLLSEAIRMEIQQHKIIIGPISDDQMFSLLDDFVDGSVAEEYVVRSVNYMNYPMQYVSKSVDTDKKLRFVRHREIRTNELQKAKETKDAADEAMTLEMITLRETEQVAVKNGTNKGRLFDEIVSSCFKAIDEYSDERKLAYLRDVVKGWLRNGVC